MISPRFEEFHRTDRFVAPWGRTVTETDVMEYAGISGDFASLHCDEEFSKKTQFGTRLAHGPLTAAIGLGLQERSGVFKNALVFLEETHRFVAPVRLGDTLYSEMAVVETVETRRPDRGVVKFANTVTNQEKKVVLQAEYTMMYLREAAGHDTR